MARYMPSLFVLDDDLEARQVVERRAARVDPAEAARVIGGRVAQHARQADRLARDVPARARGRHGAVGEAADRSSARATRTSRSSSSQTDEERLAGVEPASAFDVDALRERESSSTSMLLAELRRLAADAASVDDPKVAKVLAILEELAIGGRAPIAGRCQRRRSSQGDRVLHVHRHRRPTCVRTIVNAIMAAEGDSPLARLQGADPGGDLRVEDGNLAGGAGEHAGELRPRHRRRARRGRHAAQRRPATTCCSPPTCCRRA